MRPAPLLALCALALLLFCALLIVSEGDAAPEPRAATSEASALNVAKGWALAIVRSAGDQWRSGYGTDDGRVAWYRFTGVRRGLGPTTVRGVVMSCGVPATSPTMRCTGRSGNVRLLYTTNVRGGFVARATVRV